MDLSTITRLPADRPDLFVFEIRGRIHAADIEAMAQTLLRAFDRLETLDLMIVMRDWQGIDLGAAFDGEALKAQLRAAAHVRKYAVVGAPAWASAMINALSPLTPVEEKTFEIAQEKEAWAWIGGRPGAVTSGVTLPA